MATTGEVMSGNSPAPAMFSGQSDGPKVMGMSLHLTCGAILGTHGLIESISRRSAFTSRREETPQLPPYVTYSLLRRSLSPESESESYMA